MDRNEEIQVTISHGKNVIVEFLNNNELDEKGRRLSIFRINGAVRSVHVVDQAAQTDVKVNAKATAENHVGSPLQGKLSTLLVGEGDIIKSGDPLFILEAMKMESTVTSQLEGRVRKVYLKEGDLVAQNDLVLEIGD